MSEAQPSPAARGSAAVLGIPAFRRLWVALGLSSLGDWLGLLAVTALAAGLSTGSYAQTNVAVAGVFILRFAPAVVLGPFAGAAADRLDRRWTMVACDAVRFVVVLSIPIVGALWWLYVATFLIECAALFWTPAKEATVPNLVPRRQLEQANQLGLLATYGAAPVAAGLFALLTVTGGPLSRIGVAAVDVALVFDALTFLVAALVVARLRGIPAPAPGPTGEHPNVWQTIVEGWRFVGRTPVVRGLVVGMLGAFAAGGAAVGLARTHVADLGGGDPGYGVLFAAVFLGLAAGLGLGPRMLHDFSRRRLFGLAITAAGVSLAVLALIPDLVLVALVTFVLGGFTGLAWISGYTLLGLEVADEVRGRTFAFVQTMVRIVLVAVLAVAPLLAAAVGEHRLDVGDGLTYRGAATVFVIAGLLAAALGVTSYRQMDDRPGVPLLADLAGAVRGRPGEPERPALTGFFVAFEGGEGAGKSTQARLLAEALQEAGHDVVLTREPGATRLGGVLRLVLLDPANAGMSERVEALLYAADRAEHVHSVILPALRRGAVVVSDRYVDSSVAYQGAGRGRPVEEVAGLSRWATGGLVPGLTVVLDVPAPVGLGRVPGTPDRLEAEPAEFHERVRLGFLRLVEADPQRYLVVDATQPPEDVARRIRERLADLLPPSPREVADAEAARAAEAARRAEEGRRAELARQQRVAAARAEIERRRREHTAEVARADAELAERRRLERAEQAERDRRRAEERARARAAARSARRTRAEQRHERAVARDAQRVGAERARQAQARIRRLEAEDRRRAAQAERAAADAQRRVAQAERRAADAEGRAAESDRRRAEEAERRAAEAERRRAGEERRRAARQRRAAADAQRRVAEAELAAAEERSRRDTATPAAGDPPTRELSLTDELLALSGDDDTVEIRPELPRERRREDR